MNTIGAGEEACEEIGEWDPGQLSKVINSLGTDGGHLTGGKGQSRPHIQNHVVCNTVEKGQRGWSVSGRLQMQNDCSEKVED